MSKTETRTQTIEIKASINKTQEDAYNEFIRSVYKDSVGQPYLDKSLPVRLFPLMKGGELTGYELHIYWARQPGGQKADIAAKLPITFDKLLDTRSTTATLSADSSQPVLDCAQEESASPSELSQGEQLKQGTESLLGVPTLESHDK